MTHPHDIGSLANTALKDIQKSAATREALLHQKPKRRPWGKVGGVMLAVAVLYGVADSRLSVYWLGVSESRQLDEMTAALTAAKLAVEQSHATTGQWPDRVPLPALASLVELQNPGPTYRLLAKTQQWQLTMTPSGDLQKTQP